ncbi:hypothetical protein EMIHUDRAFT_435269 [Emiliania huxleyi CCMP1516]|uniref:Glycosyltransferase family 92 protein n=3 Tax=Emiliania huxleyi TaxID=2903 RepID=A0A0D3I9K3_EMIH1|nr:hypothetical protein EMIHUDRAFT_438441 [Emiliania huxleyi CCMP1516]XP_005777553.1 hypothetical protein EMIHUDRAFT_435269 [Emiliania huxleyi CCMP1516]EOD07938.1 hypothetical protein EMIHUDRAFT_438441 [Emiliania huxleyi CCMP1516]EOD25124.1 hypothetical protein EMIHUDRAFT_435269 [Emiliania huxleyi CCMP1516]|eukprot:XP_005760367.1 hypothetical protein EMIHUDRAFT_438441 [Emiliania huxleyi CCMP1516]
MNSLTLLLLCWVAAPCAASSRLQSAVAKIRSAFGSRAGGPRFNASATGGARPRFSATGAGRCPNSKNSTLPGSKSNEWRIGGGRLTGSAAARTYFFAFAAGSEDVLLEHFVSHYSALGINFATNSRLVLHLTGAAEVAAREQASVAYLRGKSIPFRSSPRYTSQIKALLANGYLRTLPDEALLMYPDLDEFFALPCRVGDLLARSERKFLLTAKFRERLPRHWACDPFPRLQPASVRPIHAQYPVACPIIASGARRGVFGTALSLGYQKNLLFSVRDQRGRRVQYQSSHSCTCIDDAAPDEKHECELQEYRVPDIAHFRFTHEAPRTKD